ncbi:hypothetical protein VCUG_01722 [Vavraia culicis subsp. floridensis]|uniref:Uncharacterized protein n=1 Tax=Vavraia culicis (isolate floridensis) TaxID=948595 RepID=L2GTY5_VAVCU|nr:uncharacterized protein VCUG_01722 [Vavraia culicis subsp. floridensis]ELA46763.1 hypothetical protein VCUG_01722 [Vavraia culicis subsp. floridensis]
MNRIDGLRRKQFGKIYQIDRSYDVPKNIFKIQTYGIRRADHAACPSSECLRQELGEFLAHRIHRSVLIDSVETLAYDKKMIVLFKYMNIEGVDIYLRTTGMRNVWYADKKLQHNENPV